MLIFGISYSLNIFFLSHSLIQGINIFIIILLVHTTKITANLINLHFLKHLYFHIYVTFAHHIMIYVCISIIINIFLLLHFFFLIITITISYLVGNRNKMKVYFKHSIKKCYSTNTTIK